MTSTPVGSAKDLIFGFEDVPCELYKSFGEENYDETIEDFIAKTSPETKIYVYNSSDSRFFLSQETLDKLYGNLIFSEILIPNEKPNSFNLILEIPDNPNGEMYLNVLKNRIRAFSWKRIPFLRFGMVKCFLSAPFDPFQETLNRVLAMEAIKQRLAEEKFALISFVDGRVVFDM